MTASSKRPAFLIRCSRSMPIASKNYRRDLGHDRIGLLPFAAQPRCTIPCVADGGVEP